MEQVGTEEDSCAVCLLTHGIEGQETLDTLQGTIPPMRIALAALITLVLTGTTALASAIDSDGDGLLDSEEDINRNGIIDEGETSALDADTDGGGEADGAEVQAGRDPLDRRDDFTYDFDLDGLTNGEEALLGTNPENPDTDGDGVSEGKDPFPLDERYRSDLDRDGLPDEFEIKIGLSSDKRSDGTEDADGDGLSNLDEFIEGTDPLDADTDRDGTADGIEIEEGSDPRESACLHYAGLGPQFTDIEEHWSTSMIQLLSEIKVLPSGDRIIRGYGEGMHLPFHPNRFISRYEFLKIALLSNCIALNDHIEHVSRSFTDFTLSLRPRETEDEILKKKIVLAALQHDVIQGYPDGSIKLDASVNRAEALKMLLEVSRLIDEPMDKDVVLESFPDVPEDAWFAPYVTIAQYHDLVGGYEDGTFRPGNPITRAEAVKIVLLLMISNPRVNGYVIPAISDQL